MAIDLKLIMKKFRVIESALLFIIPVLLVTMTPISSLIRGNFLLQLCIFIPFVQIPAYFTSKISYVDFGWPLGLTAMGVYGYNYGDGHDHRVLFFSFMYFMMGMRMLILGTQDPTFNQLVKDKFVIKEDLPRYQYAKTRYLRRNSENTWWIKIQAETFLQCLANGFVLCVPLFVTISNKDRGLYYTEVFSLLMWMVCFFHEAKADQQKKTFLKNCQGIQKILGKNKTEDELTDTKSIKAIQDVK